MGISPGLLHTGRERAKLVKVRPTRRFFSVSVDSPRDKRVMRVFKDSHTGKGKANPLLASINHGCNSGAVQRSRPVCVRARNRRPASRGALPPAPEPLGERRGRLCRQVAAADATDGWALRGGKPISLSSCKDVRQGAEHLEKRADRCSAAAGART